MLVEGEPVQHAALLQVIDDRLIRVLDEHPLAHGERLGELPRQVDRLEEREAPIEPQLVVVLTERRRGVHDPSTVLHVDKGGVVHPVGALIVDQPVRRFVRQTDKVSSGELAHHAVVAVERVLQQLLGEDDPLAVLLYLNVDRALCNGEADVRRQGPRGRRPGEERGHARKFQLVPGVVIRDDRHPYGDGGVLHRAVALRHLVGGESGPATGTVGENLVPLVQEPVVVHLRKLPPHALDVLIGVGYVGVLQIDPEAHPVDHPLPLALVLPDRLLAALHELLHAVRLDLRLAVDTDLLLHLQLDGKTVRVPAALTRDVEPLHRLVAGEEVLVDARHQVTEVRLTVRRRRSLEEDVTRTALRRLQRLLKRPSLLPKSQDLLFAEAWFFYQFFVLRHHSLLHTDALKLNRKRVINRNTAVCPASGAR